MLGEVYYDWMTLHTSIAYFKIRTNLINYYYYDDWFSSIQWWEMYIKYTQVQYEY